MTVRRLDAPPELGSGCVNDGAAPGSLLRPAVGRGTHVTITYDYDVYFINYGYFYASLISCRS